MKQLLNKSFYRFLSGFIGMIAVGLFGIALAGYLFFDEWEANQEVSGQEATREQASAALNPVQ
jgi:hypothetical protein